MPADRRSRSGGVSELGDPMSLSREDVAKIALLGRLSLTAEELDRLTSQLGAIVGYIEQLSELDVTGVEPMAHAVPASDVFRPDELRPSLSRKAMLANAPHADGEFYLVPAVLG
jgi:aspartyl-tRNA(Asn)/glutamyl-tRNA(Gln) amidotransferase subunit C